MSCNVPTILVLHLLDVLCQTVEEVVNALIMFGAGVYMRGVYTRSKILSHFPLNGPLSLEVNFIAGNHQRYLRSHHPPQFLHPNFHLLEAVGVSYIIDQDGSYQHQQIISHQHIS